MLVLNRSFLPVHVTTVRRACTLLYVGAARVVDPEFRLLDFDAWSRIRPRDDGPRLGLVSGAIGVPRVIQLPRLDRFVRRKVRFSRANVFERDAHTCQYCGRRLPRTQLNLDHVIPRSRGGPSTWENVVCACIRCNRGKGGRSPGEARMRLLRPPSRPEWTPFVLARPAARHYPEWRPFLGRAGSVDRPTSHT